MRLRGPGIELLRYDGKATPPVGVWDQCLKLGTFRKNGIESVFNEYTVGQMMDNFARQANDLWMDKGHDVAEALAYHNALAFVVGGKVVRFVSHSEDVRPPGPRDLSRSDGRYPPDGLFAHRYQVTPLGADPQKGLASFRYTSPLFSQNGKDETGADIGYVLYNIAATNIPFLDDVTLAYSKGEGSMADQDKEDKGDSEEMKRCYEDAGVDEKDDDKSKMDKLSRYAASLRGKVRKFEDDAKKDESKGSEDDGKKSEAMEGEAAGDQAEAKKDDDKKDGDKEAMSRVLAALNLPRDLELAKAKISTMERQLGDGAKRIGELEKFAKSIKDREANEGAQQFASEALAQGRWDPEHQGDRAKTHDWLVQAYKRSPDEAARMLFPRGRFGIARSSLMESYTRGGEPMGARREARGDMAALSGKGSELAAETMKVMTEHQKAGKTISYDQAERIAMRKAPEAAQAYTADITASR